MATLKDLEKQVKDLSAQLEAEKAKNAEQINTEALAGKENQIKALEEHIAEKNNIIKEQTDLINSLKESQKQAAVKTASELSSQVNGTPFVVQAERLYAQGRTYKKDDIVYLTDKTLINSLKKEKHITERK